MNHPTNRDITIAPLGADTEEVIRRMCADRGCTCGDRLRVDVTHLDDAQAAERVAEGVPTGAAHYDVQVHHSLECPLLAGMGRN